MDVQPFEDQPWGFTGIFDKSNGGGFLDEIYPTASVTYRLSLFDTVFDECKTWHD